MVVKCLLLHDYPVEDLVHLPYKNCLTSINNYNRILYFRVYDNAKANAVMQKAISILSSEESLSEKKRDNFRRYIHTQCAPEADFYDDDNTSPEGEDLQKVTIQIKV